MTIEVFMAALSAQTDNDLSKCADYWTMSMGECTLEWGVDWGTFHLEISNMTSPEDLLHYLKEVTASVNKAINGDAND